MKNKTETLQSQERRLESPDFTPKNNDGTSNLDKSNTLHANQTMLTHEQLNNW